MNLTNKLNELGDARASYKDFVRAVDQDLAAERFKRLAGEQGRIRTLVIEAYMDGASIADLKRAYGTKDYRTIKDILNSASAEIEARRAEAAEARRGWFTWDFANSGLTIWSADRSEFATFLVVPLEEGYLLDAESEENSVTRDWDGAILEPDDPEPRTLQLYTAINGGE